jgi:hypothetical protein
MNLEQHFCPHEDCPDAGQPGKGNIKPVRQYGQQKTWLLRCTTCRGTFAETRDTIFFRRRTSRQKIVSVYLLRQESHDGVLVPNGDRLVARHGVGLVHERSVWQRLGKGAGDGDHIGPQEVELPAVRGGQITPDEPRYFPVPGQAFFIPCLGLLV